MRQGIRAKSYNWELQVANLDSYLTQQHFRSQITPAAADDIEGDSSGGAWDDPCTTKQVVQGFNNADSGSYLFFDYGDTTTGQRPCSGDSGGWTYSDFYYVAWGATFDVPLPEIYTNCQQCTWTDVETHAGSMVMQGTMSECQDRYNFPTNLPTCSSPSGQYAPYGSWNAMWTQQINAGFGQASMTYATNIKFQGTP